MVKHPAQLQFVFCYINIKKEVKAITLLAYFTKYLVDKPK